MKIALIGYSKMGRMIENIALGRGHEISVVIDEHTPDAFSSDAFRNSDVAIEFTVPDAAETNVLKCFEAGIPIVCGTTGWNARLPEMERICREEGGTLMQASNFSVGVNIFKAISRYTSRLMNSFPQYKPSIEEVHHIHKLDHPSGTAVTLAEELITEYPRLTSWAETEDGTIHDGSVLEISHERRGEVPGIHTVTWESDQDSIILTHSAKGREGFALGAVIAAEWLADKKGFRSIDELYSDIISNAASR